MPLFMDFHYLPGVTIDEVKRAHMADLAVQKKYSVKFKQFWVNEAQGLIYCLMEGPDIESCKKAHWRNDEMDPCHCNMIEVDGGMYSAFMAYDQIVDKDDMVINKSGKPDAGHRFILTLNIWLLNHSNTPKTEDPILPYQNPETVVLQIIQRNNGRIIQQFHSDAILASFYTPESIVNTALGIKKELLQQNDSLKDNEDKIMFSMGISVGQPVINTDKVIFEKAVNQSYALSRIAINNGILTTTEMEHISLMCNQELKKEQIDVIPQKAEEFLQRLFSIVEENYTNEAFNVDYLTHKMNLSRPQLYRKTKQLTKCSPNDFIRNHRLCKAITLMKNQRKTISEIAYEVGISNPSYFAKCFQKKYGILPSQMATSLT